ncbi:hypothetical protein BKA70DRAFT_1574732 [Coprinopsis sp. MPI-PUGE-AT-0042]|nr:hypothetical protein BKA70DRAFT_1574732 [Coprinopsis sp. MPI-PUGE-AT-0042]
MGNSASSGGPSGEHQGQTSPRGRAHSPSPAPGTPHPSLKTKKSVELPDLSSLSLTPIWSNPRKTPNIPIPGSSTNKKAETSKDTRGRSPSTTFSTSDFLAQQALNNVQFPPCSTPYHQQQVVQQQRRIQELYNQSNVPAVPQKHLGVVQGVAASRSCSPSPTHSVSGSPPSNSPPSSHGGCGSNVDHSHSQSYQGTPGVGWVCTTHQGSYSNVDQPAQLHGQQETPYANAPYTDQGHGQTNTNKYRSPPWHSIPSLPPPLKAPFRPRAPSNFSLRSSLTYPNGNNGPNDDFSNNTQYSQVDSDHHDGASSIVLTHSEADDGSHDEQNGQQYGTDSGSPLLDTLEELVESVRSTPVLSDQLPATRESGRTTPIITDQLPGIVAATSDSMTVCLYPSGITEPQLESREDQCLLPTGDRDLDRFFGLSSCPSMAGEEPCLVDKPEVSSKVVAVFKEASCIEISGGVFNAAGNDIHSYQTDQQVHYYSTTLPPPPQENGPGKDSKNVWPTALLYVGLGVVIGIIPTVIPKWIG